MISILQPQEILQLRSACTTLEQRLVVFTLLDTGLRVSELASLQRHLDYLDVHGQSQSLHLSKISCETRDVLKAFFKREQKVALSERQIQRIVRRIGITAGIAIPVTPRVLRNTFGISVKYFSAWHVKDEMRYLRFASAENFVASIKKQKAEKKHPTPDER